METTKGWCKWYVSDEYITKALTQLSKFGVDMRKVFIIPSVVKDIKADYIIIYYNE